MKNGYWSINMGEYRANAHTLVYMWEHGLDSIPSGYVVHHKCRNKSCINGDHLELLSNKEHTAYHTTGNTYRKGILNTPCSIKVAQIHPDHGLIRVWESMADAQRAGFCAPNICDTCNGRYDLYFDCWWMKMK